MRICYFCNATKGLKAIWIDEEVMERHSCCMSCFNDPDNGMEDSSVSESEWLGSDYNWKAKSKVMKPLSVK